MQKYIKLMDKINKNTIIKIEGRKQFEYVYGNNERWERTGILLEYYTEQSDKYEKYVEISSDEALEIIKTQKKIYDNLYKYIVEIIQTQNLSRKYLINYVLEEGGFGNIETDIAALIYSMKDINTELMKKVTPRITNSINILYKNIDMKNEQQLIQLRTDESANGIVLIQIKELLINKQISKEKYDLLLDYFDNKIIFLDEEQKQIIASQ